MAPSPSARIRPSRVGWASVVAPLAAYATLLLALSGCLGFPPRAGSIGLERRVASFPAQGLPLHAPARVHWNEHQIPFIEAEDDRDLPFVLGMVHAHQRLAQMEVLRRVSQARLGEMIGPIGGWIDASLRAADFGRSARASYEAMRPDTRQWLDRFVEGINEHRRRVPQRPADFHALGMSDEEWTPIDVLTIGRLGGTDINWGIFYSVLRHRDDPAWPELFARISRYGLGAAPSFGGEDPISLTTGLSKSGSNTFVVAGSRTASGAAIIGNDPHVGLNLPNLWLVVGVRSPSLHAVGMMLPGVPAVLLGRNEHIAWGGTNMRSLGTAMYDVSGVPESQITTRTETIRQRWWLPRRVEVRETPLGPIMTDTPFFARARENGPPVAFKWRGHEPSDELTAFLDLNRARNFEEFRAAFAPYAVSGQNFLYADPQGNIGQVLALEFDPAAGRTAMVGVGDPGNPQHQWGRERLGSMQLPHAFNPAEGFLVSANNTPVRTDPPVTLVANADSRFYRISELIAESESLDLSAAHAIQMDVYSLQSHRVARAIAARAQRLAGLTPGAARVAAEIGAWDGRYDVDSQGAPALQAAMARLARDYYTTRYGAALAGYLTGSEAVYDLLAEDLEASKDDAPLDEALRRALAGADRDAPEGTTWGQKHLLRVTHYIGNIPVIGAAWRYREFGVAGSLKTVFKTANDVTGERHRATYGANARHVSDLSDIDENYFVLLGGQDGWIGSVNMLDQVDLWRTGGSIRVPMRPESVRAWARITTELTPAPSADPGAPR